MKKTVLKKITIIFLISILSFLVLIISTPSKFDIAIFGKNFEKHIKEKYQIELVDKIFNENFVYNKKEDDFISYYGDDNGDFSVRADMKFIEVSGRTIRCSLPVIYNNQEFIIEFVGTKIIGDIYKWEMVPNDLFPIKDKNIIK